MTRYEKLLKGEITSAQYTQALREAAAIAWPTIAVSGVCDESVGLDPEKLRRVLEHLRAFVDDPSLNGLPPGDYAINGQITLRVRPK